MLIALSKVSLDKLAEGGIVMGSKLRQVKNTWLLLDDAQNAYHRKFDPFWHFVIKSIAGANVDENLFVIIAATYDLSTLESPADFHGLEHIDPNVMEEEVKSLFHMHAEVWGYEDWKNFRRTLIQVSKFSNVQSYHIGVAMAGIRMLAEMRKQPGQQDLNKEDALNVLHREEFTWSLDRCSKLPNALPEHFKDHLLDMVMGDGQDGVLGDDSLITPFIWAGLLTKIGKFSNIAARWYYNHRCFPN